jgi:hypothetical protein
LAAAAPRCEFEDQIHPLPARASEFAWHLGDGFSGLRKARSLAAAAGGAGTIRIAHLDTGYDAGHRALAGTSIDGDLQRNFVDSDRPRDARDLGVDGLLKSPGHGTGTLSILAGGKFEFSANGYAFDDILGGAPAAKIVPIRVGNSVVQLTTKNVALGINYAADLCANEATRIHVLSMSMGGVASAAWADAVNKAYEAGIVFVAAAGNNFSANMFGFPTRQIVYPARFGRVIAACGVMANGQPYDGLPAGTMQGNWGPATKMATALAAYTPNIAWAMWGCAELVRMSGAGTSAATPQIAAAAALYLQRHFGQLFDANRYPEAWMRVEAVRQALFESADRGGATPLDEKLGHGRLRAAEALGIAPIAAHRLRKSPQDEAGLPFLNVLSSRGLTPSNIDLMLQLEATQLVQRWNRRGEANPLEEAIPDPDRPATEVRRQAIEKFLEAVAELPAASRALKQRAQDVYMTRSRRRQQRPGGQKGPGGQASKGGTSTRRSGKTTAATGKPAAAENPPSSEQARPLLPPVPPYRSLRGYAVDPSLSTQLETAPIAETTFQVPWEELKPGPVGEYIEVVDVDPPSRTFYAPVDLDSPALLAQDGLPPSEGVPQFHQQMVYAVCSLTIQNFERALGRKALWRPGPPPEGADAKDDSHYVRKLRVYPHALREANAYYSPNKVALLFGYFDSVNVNDGAMLPGGRVFTCLSHDIVAHETTHALLDGMHRRFLLPSNRDVHAFHEGFADCVAMLQHFTLPDLVAHQIQSTRGALSRQKSLLTQLAVQFGFARGNRTALRDAVGAQHGGEWLKDTPNPQDYETVHEPHARGRILVAAVFDAFLSIYERRSSDLLRLATGGSGVLPTGAIHPDLVNRLAEEASRSAQHVLTMCIRALDYCPPTDITFGEYLRAIITADCDLVPDDRYNYRVSFIEAFQRRGIFPPGVRTLSVGSLRWRSIEEELREPSVWLRDKIGDLRLASHKLLYSKSRNETFFRERALRIKIHRAITNHFGKKSRRRVEADAQFLGLNPAEPFEVHTARIAFRTRPDGGILPQLLIGLLQSSQQPVHADDPKGLKMDFEGGCMLIADLYKGELQYCIRKDARNPERLGAQQAFALGEFDTLGATYSRHRPLNASASQSGNEPFALLHRAHNH